MKKVIAIVAVVLLILYTALTCPSAQQHQTAMANTMSGIESEKGESIMADVIIKDISEHKLSIDNYLLFSLSRLQGHDGDKTVALGLFNHIYILSESDIRQIMADNGL